MIGIVTEGRSDKSAVGEICSKLGIRIRIRKMDKNNLRKAKRLADLLFSDGCRKVIVLKDLHNSTPSDIKTKFEEAGFEDKVKLCTAVRAIESWLFADEKALSDYLGSEVEQVHNPEDISKPDELLDKIFNKAKGWSYYKGGKDPTEIAKRLRLEVVKNRCPSFKEFCAIIKS